MTPKWETRRWCLARLFQQAATPASVHFRNHNDFRQMNRDVTATEARTRNCLRHFRETSDSLNDDLYFLLYSPVTEEIGRPHWNKIRRNIRFTTDVILLPLFFFFFLALDCVSRGCIESENTCLVWKINVAYLLKCQFIRYVSIYLTGS